MNIKELDYKLPPSLIAERPASPRDGARLMVLDRANKKIKHLKFFEIDKVLKPGDVLVFNNSKVFSARIAAKREDGKTIEVLFISEVSDFKWEVLIRGRVKDGQLLRLNGGLKVTIKKGEITVALVSLKKSDFFRYLNKYGQVPLPPYIKRLTRREDKINYQNVFAKKIGSAAAPTAGLHFTNRLLKKLKNKGIKIEYITLHVGLGTFAPIREAMVEQHQIHTEHFEIKEDVAKRLNLAKKNGQRIIACGTTSLRALESASRSSIIKEKSGETDIYIYPGYKFRFVDGLITNFHTPRSSLLALVFAFGSTEYVKKAYQLAIRKKYRFFSYGDGMIIV